MSVFEGEILNVASLMKNAKISSVGSIYSVRCESLEGELLVIPREFLEEKVKRYKELANDLLFHVEMF